MPARVDAQTRQSVRRVAEVLRELGHEVEERDPGYARASDTVTVRYLAGVAQDAERFPRPERLQRRTRGFIRMGRAARPLLGWALGGEAAHAARINEIFRDFDVLLTPTTARPPVAAGQWEGASAARTLIAMAAVYPFTGIWNVTGQPAVSIPAPPTRDGLPIGAQLIGPPDAEARLLSLAAQLEAELDWPRRRPGLGG
jgi:amidase